MVKEKNIVLCILLSFITCGIYEFIWMADITDDTNALSDIRTASGGTAVLYTILTCGIYGWIWYYNLGNRMAENASRYGLSFSENGTTILMWMIFGSVLFGIGPFIAWHIIIKNMNALAAAYNAR